MRKKRKMMSSPTKVDHDHSIPELPDDFLDHIENEEGFFQLRLPDPDHIPSLELLEENLRPEDGKVTRLYSDQRREVVFPNKVRRDTWPDGYSVVYFTNGDVKQSFSTRTVYHFQEQQTTQTTYPNGLQVFRFLNRQLEKHFPDGTKEITFPDGTLKCVFAEEEESIFPDGTVQRVNRETGVSVVEFPDGTRDTAYPDGRRVREDADGTVRVIVQNGDEDSIG